MTTAQAAALALTALVVPFDHTAGQDVDQGAEDAGEHHLENHGGRRGQLGLGHEHELQAGEHGQLALRNRCRPGIDNVNLAVRPNSLGS